MVEATSTVKEDMGQVDFKTKPVELQEFFEYHDYEETFDEVDEETNKDTTECELESLASILNEIEYSKLSVDEGLAESASSQLSDI